MKTIEGIINDVPEKMLPKPLEPGQTVRYQLLTGNPNPDPELRKDNPIIFPMCNSIPAKDRIKNIETGRFIDIAFVESIEGKNFSPKNITIWGQSTGGFFACTGGNVNEEELYEYLELCNYNESNPNRDTSKEPIFKKVEEHKDAEKKVKKRSVKLEAMQYASRMSEGQIKDFAAGMGWNEKQDIEILIDKVQDFAEQHPDDFKKIIESPDKDVKALVKRAIDADKIKYDPSQHRIVLASNNQTLVKLDRVEGEDYLKQVAEYILYNQKNGDKVLNTIKKLMTSSDPS